MGPRTLIVWCVAAAVTTAFAVATSLESSREVATAGRLDEPVFEGLRTAPETAALIVASHGGEDVTLALADGRWVVSERFAYPADAEAVRSLVTELADLRYAAPRTAIKERFARLAVDDPGEGSAATRVTVEAGDGTVLADAVIGKASEAITQDRRGTYLRLPSAERAWLASGTVDVPTTAIDWLDTDLPGLARDELGTLTVTPAVGEGFTVARLDPNEDLTLVDQVPEGREVDAEAVRRLAGALAGLRFEDLRPSGDVAWPETVTRVVGAGFDEQGVTLELAVIDGATWARFDAIEGWIYRLPEVQTGRLEMTLDDLLVEKTS